MLAYQNYGKYLSCQKGVLRVVWRFIECASDHVFSRSHFHLHQEYILATYLQVIGTWAKISFPIRCAAITREFSSITSHSRIYIPAPKYNQHLWETAQIMVQLCARPILQLTPGVFYNFYDTFFSVQQGCGSQLDGKKAIVDRQVNE